MHVDNFLVDFTQAPRSNEIMNTLKRIFKIVTFGVILLVFSAVHRLFGEKQEHDKSGPLSMNSAKADIPACGEPPVCTCGCTDSSTDSG